jgi:hypothetical protein
MRQNIDALCDRGERIYKNVLPLSLMYIGTTLDATHLPLVDSVCHRVPRPGRLEVRPRLPAQVVVALEPLEGLPEVTYASRCPLGVVEAVDFSAAEATSGRSEPSL